MTPPRRQRGRGGKGGHEPRAQIRLREARVLELSLQGHPQVAIAQDVGISQPAVSKILQRLETRVFQETAGRVERHRARQALRLEHVVSQAMLAWQRSQTERTRRRQRKSQHGAPPREATMAELVTEHPVGDPRYLDQARKALADQRKLWGLDAPQNVDLRTPTNPFEGMTEAALRHELARQDGLLSSKAVVSRAADDQAGDQ